MYTCWYDYVMFCIFVGMFIGVLVSSIVFGVGQIQIPKSESWNSTMNYVLKGHLLCFNLIFYRHTCNKIIKLCCWMVIVSVLEMICCVKIFGNGNLPEHLFSLYRFLLAFFCPNFQLEMFGVCYHLYLHLLLFYLNLFIIYGFQLAIQLIKQSALTFQF